MSRHGSNEHQGNGSKNQKQLLKINTIWFGLETTESFINGKGARFSQKAALSALSLHQLNVLINFPEKSRREYHYQIKTSLKLYIY